MANVTKHDPAPTSGRAGAIYSRQDVGRAARTADQMKMRAGENPSWAKGSQPDRTKQSDYGADDIEGQSGKRPDDMGT